jgi:hypothetical protein
VSENKHRVNNNCSQLFYSAVQTALTTDSRMGWISQLDILNSVHLGMTRSSCVLESTTVGENPVTLSWVSRYSFLVSWFGWHYDTDLKSYHMQRLEYGRRKPVIG